MSTIKKIQSVERRRARLLKKMLRADLMIRGALAETYRRCGKENCWCAEGKGHPYLRITWTEKGQAKTKAVRKQDLHWVARTTENYRKFRSLRSEMRKLNARLKCLLDVFEEEVIQRSKKQKEHLR